MLANVVRLCAEWRLLFMVKACNGQRFACELACWLRAWVEFDSSFGTYVCRRWSIAWLNGRGVFLAAVIYCRFGHSGGNGLLRDR